MPNYMNSSCQKPVPIERRLKSRSSEYNFEWNQPCLTRASNLRRASNSLNSASALVSSNLSNWIAEVLKELWCSDQSPSSRLIRKYILQEVVNMPYHHSYVTELFSQGNIFCKTCPPPALLKYPHLRAGSLIVIIKQRDLEGNPPWIILRFSPIELGEYMNFPI